ncbi:MAG: diguanylate cyclase [Candidatus Lustribacter sp.]|jgi:diguanylate cyclase (GGDEF)-like protein
MSASVAQQLLLMLVQGVFVGALLVAAFRLRRTFGLALVYIVFGVIFQYANLLAGSVYIPLSSWLVVSPGSVVLFPAILFLVLFVYLSDDAVEARKLIYGVAIANVVFVPLGLLVAVQLQSPQVINPFHVMPDLFEVQPRIVVSSGVVLFIDTLIVVLLYEWVSRYTRSIFLRVWGSLTLTLYFDSIAFATAAFAGSPAYVDIMLSQLAGKTVAALVYSVVLVMYLHYFNVAESMVVGEGRALGTMFRVLTYRQRYEELQKVVVRDALTNVYNRGFFDEAIEKYVAMSKRSGRPICMMMVDVDFFKRVNDTYGHAEGDRVLQLIAGSIQSTLRVSDYVCRYGGEEFAILLPQTDLDQAVKLAERVVAELPAALSSGWRGAGAMDVTVTVGVAEFPREAADGAELVRVADRRLYAGKAAGRNRVAAAAG